MVGKRWPRSPLWELRPICREVSPAPRWAPLPSACCTPDWAVPSPRPGSTTRKFAPVLRSLSPSSLPLSPGTPSTEMCSRPCTASPPLLCTATSPRPSASRCACQVWGGGSQLATPSPLSDAWWQVLRLPTPLCPKPHGGPPLGVTGLCSTESANSSLKTEKAGGDRSGPERQTACRGKN